MEWAGQFFSSHTQLMVDKGLITQAEGRALVDDWEAHRRNPDAMFFSPLVIDIAGINRR
jgi:hypothetical protein